MSVINPCPFCHEKQEEINRLKDEIVCLKDRLRHRERKEADGFFGSSTPSSQKSVKVNTEGKPKKPRGAKDGHMLAAGKSVPEMAGGGFTGRVGMTGTFS